MNSDRRIFIKNLGVLAAGSAAGILTACTKHGTNPLEFVDICQNTCTGCGDCVDSCQDNAILLEQKSTYVIDIDDCTECGQCVPHCKLEAIHISSSQYILDSEECIGCGLCIDVCDQEAQAIVWEREEYLVRGKCRNTHCNFECAAACPENAITIVNNTAVIDMEKCTRCGLCIAPCPAEAINPAHVEMVVDQCTRCGKCFDVCEFDAITKVEPEGYSDPHIDAEVCNACSECKDYCPENAIYGKLFKAQIDNENCTACGECFEKCTYDAIRHV